MSTNAAATKNIEIFMFLPTKRYDNTTTGAAAKRLVNAPKPVVFWEAQSVWHTRYYLLAFSVVMTNLT